MDERTQRARNEGGGRIRAAAGEWFRAEAAAEIVVADRAFRRAFSWIPVPSPSAGFAERILEQVVPLLPRRRDPFARPLVRWAIAASFLLFGTFFGGLPRLVSGLVSRLRPGTVIDVIQGVPVVLSNAMTGILGLWPLLSTLSEATVRFISTPAVLAGLMTLTLMAVASLRVVTDLVVRQKGLAHVDLV